MTAKLTYWEQLKHPLWQRRRLEIMGDAGFKCEECGDKDSTLNVHHRIYIKGRMAWDYADHELACLCEPCHRKEHAHRETLDRMLSVGSGRLQLAIGLLGGYLAATLDADFGEEETAQAIGGDAFLVGAAGATLMPSGRPNRAVVEALLAARRTEELNPGEAAFIDLLVRLVGGDG